jgi:hypothetical protein
MTKVCAKCGTKGKELNPLTEYADGWRCKWCHEYMTSIRKMLEKGVTRKGATQKTIYKEESEAPGEAPGQCKFDGRL